MTDNNTVSSVKAFVIGPIGDKDAEDGSPSRQAYEEGIEVFEEVISPACKGYGLEPIRADMMSSAGEIPEQIFRLLRDCPVVIADLSGANPNVMYELGLRHTTGKVTIQIGEKERLPFDLSSIRTIMFKRTSAGLVQARKDLSKFLAENLDSGGSPVTATRIWFENPLTITDPDLELKEDGDVDSDEDSPGFLELMAEMEIGIQSLSQTITALGLITEEIGNIYLKATQDIMEADARGASAIERLAIADFTAQKLDQEAAKLEVVSGEYANTVDRIEPGLKYLLEQLISESGKLGELAELPIHINAMAISALSSIEQTLTMRDNALEMGKASRSLKRVGQRLSTPLSRIADTSARVGKWRELAD